MILWQNRFVSFYMFADFGYRGDAAPSSGELRMRLFSHVPCVLLPNAGADEQVVTVID